MKRTSLDQFRPLLKKILFPAGLRHAQLAVADRQPMGRQTAVISRGARAPEEERRYHSHQLEDHSFCLDVTDVRDLPQSWRP